MNDDIENDIPSIERTRPRLWNPNAAASWSLLLTPAFGACLHALNWRALGKPERAVINIVWVGVTIVFLAVNFATIFMPASVGLDGAMRVGGLAILLLWYYTQGRGQAKYVTDVLEDDYIKRPWSGPLLMGFFAVGAYVAVAVAIAMAAYTPSPDELAAEIKPLILKEWQKRPELQGASIQSITLSHKEGNFYTGFVNATVGGQAMRMLLDVEHNHGTIAWQLTPLAEH